jgi:cobalt/nickel transport system permease protein
MFDLFLDFFAYRDNFLTRMDARIKIMGAIALIWCDILSSKILLPLIILVTCVAVLLIIGVPGRFVSLKIVSPAGIVLVLMALQTFTVPGTVLFTVTLGGAHFPATYEGLQRGVVLGARIFCAVTVMTLLGATVPAQKMFHALRWLKCPATWVETALLMYRYIFLLADQTSDILAAQRLRLGYSTVQTSLRSLGVLGGTILTRSLDQATRTYEAMSLRGYDGIMKFDPLPRMSRRESFGVVAFLVSVTSLYVLLEWYV